MSTASIPVDPLNPGQVFACLGFAELSESLNGTTFGGFDWSERGVTRFVLRVGGDTDPVAAGLDFLAAAEVRSLSPAADLSTNRRGVPTDFVPPGSEFPTPVPSSPATLPAVLTTDGKSVVVSSWGEVRSRHILASERDNVKFWGGASGYPGAGLIRDALAAARPGIAAAREDPFALRTPQSSSLRFDWRRDYIPIDIGFSLNPHAWMIPQGYPLVEVLAVLGLSNARPRRVRKLLYRYAIAGRCPTGPEGEAALLPMPLLRAVLGLADIPFPTRTFTMHLDRPDHQARCITLVQEETC